MMLTPRDLDIIHTLLEVQFLTVDQIRRLFFPSPCSCRNRLALLRQNEWLEEKRPWPNYMPRLTIQKLGKTTFKRFGYPSSKKRGYILYLEHRLELNDLYVHLRCTGILRELNLCWQDGSNFDIPYQGTYFRPDARMIGNFENMIYLEYDRGTKNLSIIQENLSKYLDWFDEQERRTSAIARMHLIYVTPKNSRALAIQKQFKDICLKQNRTVPDTFLFHSLTTQEFLDQSKLILSSSNKGQLSLVHEGQGQTNQNAI